MKTLIIVVCAVLAFLLFRNKNMKKPIKRELPLFNENSWQNKTIGIDPTPDQKASYKYKN